MERIGHIDALPPLGLNGTIDHIPRLRRCSHSVERLRQRRPDPLRDIRPAFLARQVSDLTALGKSLQVGDRKGCEARNKAIDGEAPIHKAILLVAFEIVTEWRTYFVCER